MTNEEKDKAMAGIHAETDEENVGEIRKALKVDLDKNIKEMEEGLKDIRMTKRMIRLFEYSIEDW